MNSLKLSALQYNIAWEDKKANLRTVEHLLAASREKTDVVVLPEMFSTGFSMNSEKLSEEKDGETMSRIKMLAQKYDLALCGSFIAKENNKFYNRGFFVTPDEEYFCDKRHLFRMGSEATYFSAGKKRLIIPFRGFNICLMVCYDLRFPVWARNVENEYDLLIYVANWPESRSTVWKTLLSARAIENLSYVCGVNRIGKDGLGLNYIGESTVIDFKGKILSQSVNTESMQFVELSKDSLEKFRAKFPVWKDADKFELLLNNED